MRYLRNDQCTTCGQPHWFRYWIGEHAASPQEGLVVGDLDFLCHRFKKKGDSRGSRGVEHIMVVEMKVADERLGDAQRDSLSVFNSALNTMIPSARTPIGVRARPQFIRRHQKKIVWHGVHLVRVPHDDSPDGPFWWDNRPIEAEVLAEVLSFDRDPRNPKRVLDVDRRHKRQLEFSLFQ